MKRGDNNVVLTGLPRGGTTLTCHLLNQLPDTVALHEPIPPARFDGLDKDEILESAEAFYARMRGMIRRRGVAISKRIRERITDPGYSPDPEAEARRRATAGKRKVKRKEKKVRVDKELTPDSLLAIKSPAMFAALLPVLAVRFPAYAVVRNPLPVLASWNSYDGAATRQGHSPAAERYDEDLRLALATVEDRVERQLRLLSWYFARFDEVLPASCVLRYEEIVRTGGRALSAVTPAAAMLDEPLSDRNLNPAYDRDRMRELGEKLLESEGAYWLFYSREDVEGLLAGL